MIIDSHAHYTHGAFQNNFRYLTYGEDGYALSEGDLAQLLHQLQNSDIRCSIEPGVSLSGCQEILQLCAQQPGYLFPAIGVHPTRCISEQWSGRHSLASLADTPGIVAIGETGLDFHYERKNQHRLTQYMWFLYQLNLARKKKLPLILHVRDAHKAALAILKHHPARTLGGVIHCFYGDTALAKQYLDLGYHIGIGGSLLQNTERVKSLQDAVIHIPTEKILLETDAPFILPYCKDTLPPKLLRRARNTSLILPAVIQKIAELKNISPAEVEAITTQNAIRLFSLPF